MENIKNKKLALVFSIIIAVLIVAYIATMTMPLITYTRTEPAAVAGQEETISLMQYLWFPYNYQDLTREYMTDVYNADLGVKYDITDTIAAPLFAFIVAFIAIAFVLVFYKKFWSVLFPIIWSVGSLVLYALSSLFTVSAINPTTILTHKILFVATLVVSIVLLVLYSIPKLRYDIAHRERL